MSAMSEWNVVTAKPGPIGNAAGGAAVPAMAPEQLRSEIITLLGRIDGEPGVPTEIFEAAHEMLLRALGTVDRA